MRRETRESFRDFVSEFGEIFAGCLGFALSVAFGAVVVIGVIKLLW